MKSLMMIIGLPIIGNTSDKLKQNKLVRYKEANAPENPFVAAASASRKKAPSSSSTSETLSQPGKSSLFC